MTMPAAAAEAAPDIMPIANRGEIVITTVFDNYAVDARLVTRWGFAAVISTPSATVLFDTGSDGATLLANMAKLRIDPAGIDKIIISHRHNDHAGGLARFLRRNAKVHVYLGAGFPDRLRRTVNAAGANYQDVSAAIDVAPGIRTTGPLGTKIQEQALVVETAKGLIIVTGCAHPGIVDIVRKVKAMSAEADIALVMGGFHLLSASRKQIDAIVLALRKLGVRQVVPSHCTGDLARRRFKEIYGKNYLDGGVGMVIRFASRPTLAR